MPSRPSHSVSDNSSVKSTGSGSGTVCEAILDIIPCPKIWRVSRARWPASKATFIERGKRRRFSLRPTSTSHHAGLKPSGLSRRWVPVFRIEACMGYAGKVLPYRPRPNLLGQHRYPVANEVVRPLKTGSLAGCRQISHGRSKKPFLLRSGPRRCSIVENPRRQAPSVTVRMGRGMARTLTSLWPA